MKELLLWIGVAVTPLCAQIEAEVPLQRPDEEAATARQSQMLYDVIDPVVDEASASAVWVWSGGRMISLGTVIGDGHRILTKWSQIAFARGALQVVDGHRREATATVVGVYEDDDLALLEVVEEDVTFTPVEWGTGESPSLGRFLISADPEGAARMGVVAVEERILRLSNQPFFGVVLENSDTGEGVRIAEIDESGGADDAGLRIGDVLLSADGVEMNAPFDLRPVLEGKSPGDAVEVEFRRGDQKQTVEVVLGDKSKYKKIPEGRLRVMRSMGGPISLRGEDFPVVIQTDMQLRPEQCGGPVVDLDGDVIGLSISRTDRTRSFIIPAARILELLEEEPVAPNLAAVPGNRRGAGRGPRQQVVPIPQGAADAMRAHLEEMAEFMRRMDREMAPFGP